MLNWYRIERILGRGGFGVIYLATDTNLDHQVAIKEYIPGDVATRAEDSSVHPITEDHGRMFRWGMERFIKEARNLVKFKHPNIVRVMSIFQENNTAYMVMEFEEGEELRTYLKRSEANTEHNLKALILPISQGLAEVHRHGFVHRDIKPANILVRKNGSPVLLDFGSARNASRFTQQQNMTALVSAGYAPLEQYNVEGEEQQGPWTDIYALGGVLYYAISGNDPADSTRRGAAMINGGVDPLVPAVKLGQGRYSEAFLSAIDWALQFRIADRPQTLADWMPALLGDRTVKDAQQSTREWVDKNGFASGIQSRLDGETMEEMSDATVLSRARADDMSGLLERPFPETTRKSKRSARPLAWLSLILIVGAGAAWVKIEKPELINTVVASLYQSESRAEQAAALLAEQEAARKIAEGEAARKLAEERAAAEAEEAARQLAQQRAAARLAEEQAARKLAEEAAAREKAEEAARRLADEEATRKLAEQAALQEKRRQEARLRRRLNSALANIAIAITRGELDNAQQELATAKSLGIRDSRIAARETQLKAAIAEHNKPVSDNDFDTVMRMFDALKRAIEGKDITAVGRLTNGSDQTQLFEALNKRFDRIEIEISGIKVRNADKSISAQLEIESMVRSNGDRAIPSDAYRLRTIKSKRVNGSWSVIEW